MEASIIIPNFNGEKLLQKNLPEVIRALENSENRIKEVIVVDDGSSDGSVKLIRRNFPQVKLIKHTKNRGFSATVNTGIRTAEGELMVLLNSDVVPSPDFLVSILPHFANPKVFAVSLHEKDYAWAKGYFADGFIQIGMGKETEVAHESFYVSGGSGVFRRKIWMELGGMDEKLLSPFYWEDIDLCYRAAKKGFRLLWEPKAMVLHQHESTISKLSQTYVQRIRERNQLLFLWKNLLSPSLFKKHLLGVVKRLLRHPGYARIIFMALLRLKIVKAARKKEIKESKISDEAILARFK